MCILKASETASGGGASTNVDITFIARKPIANRVRQLGNQAMRTQDLITERHEPYVGPGGLIPPSLMVEHAAPTAIKDMRRAPHGVRRFAQWCEEHQIQIQNWTSAKREELRSVGAHKVIQASWRINVYDHRLHRERHAIVSCGAILSRLGSPMRIFWMDEPLMVTSAKLKTKVGRP